jgi:phage regulator Rha-like protein
MFELIETETKETAMNIATISDTTTMTSREIADLTGKQHKDVLYDIRKMLDELGKTSADFSADLPDSYGRPQPGFALPMREALILTSGYSVKQRAAIIDRWHELEQQAALRASMCLPLTQKRCASPPIWPTKKPKWKRSSHLPRRKPKP